MSDDKNNMRKRSSSVPSKGECIVYFREHQLIQLDQKTVNKPLNNSSTVPKLKLARDRSLTLKPRKRAISIDFLNATLSEVTAQKKVAVSPETLPQVQQENFVKAKSVRATSLASPVYYKHVEFMENIHSSDVEVITVDEEISKETQQDYTTEVKRDKEPQPKQDDWLIQKIKSPFSLDALSDDLGSIRSFLLLPDNQMVSIDDRTPAVPMAPVPPPASDLLQPLSTVSTTISDMLNDIYRQDKTDPKSSDLMQPTTTTSDLLNDTEREGDWIDPSKTNPKEKCEAKMFPPLHMYTSTTTQSDMFTEADEEEKLVASQDNWYHQKGIKMPSLNSEEVNVSTGDKPPVYILSPEQLVSVNTPLSDDGAESRTFPQDNWIKEIAAESTQLPSFLKYNPTSTSTAGIPTIEDEEILIKAPITVIDSKPEDNETPLLGQDNWMKVCNMEPENVGRYVPLPDVTKKPTIQLQADEDIFIPEKDLESYYQAAIKAECLLSKQKSAVLDLLVDKNKMFVVESMDFHRSQWLQTAISADKKESPPAASEPGPCFAGVRERQLDCVMM